jgi:hypothetical protein
MHIRSNLDRIFSDKKLAELELLNIINYNKPNQLKIISLIN